MVVGFYVHTDMNFVVTERDEKVDSHVDERTFEASAQALPGAYDE